MARDLAAFVVPDARLAGTAGLDPEAAGLRSVPTPRHASVLLLVGDLPEGLARAAAVAYAQMPRPRAILAAGGGASRFLPAADVSVALGQDALRAGVDRLRALLAEGAFSPRAAALDSEALQTRTQYTCPMHPDIVRSEPGRCPICGMDLVPRDAAEAVTPHEHAGTGTDQAATPSSSTGASDYTCPMHPEIVRSEPGRCSICGMDLVPKPPVRSSGMGTGTRHEGHDMERPGGAASIPERPANRRPTAAAMGHAHHGVAPDRAPVDHHAGADRAAPATSAVDIAHGTAPTSRRGEHQAVGQQRHGDVVAPAGGDEHPGHGAHGGHGAYGGHVPTGAAPMGHGHEPPDPALRASAAEAALASPGAPSAIRAGRTPVIDHVHHRAPGEASQIGHRMTDGAEPASAAARAMGGGDGTDGRMPTAGAETVPARRNAGPTNYAAMATMKHAAPPAAAPDRGDGGAQMAAMGHAGMGHGGMDQGMMDHGGMDHGGHTMGGFMSMVAMTKDLPRSRDGLPMEWVEAPFGPLFPGLPAGLALTLTLDGDTVAGAALAPGATRRGLEATWPGPVATFADRLARLDPLAPVAYRTLAYRALEAVSGAAADAAPARGRVGALEQERAASHIGWLAALGGLLGDRSLARWAADLQLALVRALRIADVARIATDVRSLTRGVERMPLLGRRLAGIGRLGAEIDAMSGPVVRGGGAAVDERAGEVAYRELGFSPMVAEGGDALARLRVRLREIGQSLDLVAAAGSLAAPPASPPPDLSGLGAATIETPRGAASLRVEVDRGTVTGVWLDDRPRRYAALVPTVAEGAELADALVGIASLDLSPWEIDR